MRFKLFNNKLPSNAKKEARHYGTCDHSLHLECTGDALLLYIHVPLLSSVYTCINTDLHLYTNDMLFLHKFLITWGNIKQLFKNLKTLQSRYILQVILSFVYC
jgi:hypothetical protein